MANITKAAKEDRKRHEEKKKQNGNKSASVTGSSAKAAKLKLQIAGILMDAIGGTRGKYRTPEGFIRWGVVEGDMNETIDAALR